MPHFEGCWLLALPKADWGNSAQGASVSVLKLLSSIHVDFIQWHVNRGVKSSWSSHLLCGTCFMQLDESCWDIRFTGSRKNGFAYYPVLCCLHLCDVLYPFRHLGGITLFWVVRCLPILWIRRQGFGSHIMVTQDPLCDFYCSDKRWWRQSQVTISRFSACWSWCLDGKLLQALSLAMAFGYWINAGWVLLWVRRNLSPSLSLFGMLDFNLKVSCLLLTQQAPT